MKLSPLVIGTMRLGIWDAAFSTVQYQGFIEGCLELGFSTFDHADIYGDYTTEGDFGKVLKADPSLRDKVEIVTKCGIQRVCDNRPSHRIKTYNSSKAHIIASVENSLSVLETDYIDMLLLHRPDYLMEPDEIADAFRQLQQQGKVRTFGVSNFTPSQFDLLNASFPLITNQVQASILHLDPFDDGTLDQCLKHKVQPMAWSPLGGGAIFSVSEDARIQRIQTVAKPLCEKYGLELDQLLLSWLLRHPSKILPVTGTTKLSRIQSAAKALETPMDRTDWYDLWQASTGQTIA